MKKKHAQLNSEKHTHADETERERVNLKKKMPTAFETSKWLKRILFKMHRGHQSQILFYTLRAWRRVEKKNTNKLHFTQKQITMYVRMILFLVRAHSTFADIFYTCFFFVVSFFTIFTHHVLMCAPLLFIVLCFSCCCRHRFQSNYCHFIQNINIVNGIYIVFQFQCAIE